MYGKIYAAKWNDNSHLSPRNGEVFAHGKKKNLVGSNDSHTEWWKFTSTNQMRITFKNLILLKVARACYI